MIKKKLCLVRFPNLNSKLSTSLHPILIKQNKSILTKIMYMMSDKD